MFALDTILRSSPMEKLVFSVDSALLSELGEKLVESVHVALLELVKNSYDADATKAIVKIVPYDDDKYKIVVKDDGTGMTLEDVKRYWMRIATTNKADNKISTKFGRTKSGSKGIGRFSCRRLGSQLQLETTAQINAVRYETTKFCVNWAQFIPGTSISEIECESTTTTSDEGKTGTRLEIISDRAGWTHQGWSVLKRRLMLLVMNRGGALPGKKKDPGFNIKLIAPDFEESRVVNPREQLMDAGWGRLSLIVEEDGRAVWNLDAKDIGTKTITTPYRYPDLVGTSADIAILPDVKDQFRNPNLVGINSLRDALDDWGGVFVRADGIRVYPYGEKGDDWLQIDKDRGLRKGKSTFDKVTELARSLKGVADGRELLNLLSAKSHVGEVWAESPTELFDLKASREGFVGEEAISMLRKVVRFGIDWATVFRDYYLRIKELEKLKRAKQEFQKVADLPVDQNEAPHIYATKYLEEQIRSFAQALPNRESKQVVDSVGKAINLILESEKVRTHELQHLRLVAATSSLFLVFQHEVRSLLTSFGQFDMRLKNLARKVSDSGGQKDISEMRKYFADTKGNFNNLLEMTSLLSIDAKRDTAKRLDISVRAKRAVDCFRLICENYNLDVDVSGIDRALKVGPMLEAELLSIFMNALSNSIKSVIAAGKKNIAIQATPLADGRVKINILDTGLGVDPGDEDLFMPFIADPKGQLYSSLQEKLNPEDEHIVGTGSGLGLAIVRDIATSHNGSARFTNPPRGNWTCNLEVILK